VIDSACKTFLILMYGFVSQIPFWLDSPVVFQQAHRQPGIGPDVEKGIPSNFDCLEGASLEDDIADEVMKGCPWLDYRYCGDAEVFFSQNGAQA
jgi:hypothetical protein